MRLRCRDGIRIFEQCQERQTLAHRTFTTKPDPLHTDCLQVTRPPLITVLPLVLFCFFLLSIGLLQVCFWRPDNLFCCLTKIVQGLFLSCDERLKVFSPTLHIFLYLLKCLFERVGILLARVVDTCLPESQNRVRVEHCKFRNEAGIAPDMRLRTLCKEERCRCGAKLHIFNNRKHLRFCSVHTGDKAIWLHLDGARLWYLPNGG